MWLWFVGLLAPVGVLGDVAVATAPHASTLHTEREVRHACLMFLL